MEAVGIAAAAKEYGVPCVISFVLKHGGRLLSDEDPADVIAAVDRESKSYPLGYTFNCSPLESLEEGLRMTGGLVHRVICVYPNASSFPQKDLQDEALLHQVHGVLDSEGVAAYLNGLRERYKLVVIGGCCGFTPQNIAHISRAVQEGYIQQELPLTDFARAAK